ncbi:MAG: peptidoglycan editing factor PgeF [Prevotella sp.]|nr:peptidoglycan editing factor PgeF [Prevotella sp.]
MNNPQLTYYDLGEGVTAFSTTRHGGCSTGNYSEFNINRYCGDDAGHIAQNLHALAALLDIPADHIIMPHQVHGIEVRRIDGPQQEVIEGVDAVMTDVPQLCIGVSTADCIPIIIYDKEHHAACAVHAGWRGTVQRIVRVAVEAMCKTYGSLPSQMKAVIGPGISLDSFEVGEEVYQQFADASFDMRLIARMYAKWHIDLPMCNRLQLEETGITDIYMSGICTYQHHQDYFSARRLGINSGRIFTGVMVNLFE